MRSTTSRAVRMRSAPVAMPYAESSRSPAISAARAFGEDALDGVRAAADPAVRRVVGGLCWSRVAGRCPYPTMYELVEKGPGRIGFVRPETVPQDRLVRVSATGTGFLLIHRLVLEKVRETSGDEAAPWFREMPAGEPLALMGEDLTFCLRAGAAGFPVYV